MTESALDYEIAQEQAAALGRLGRALEAAITALSSHDNACAERSERPMAPASFGDPIREQLVQDASNALWCFIIQREACGLRDQRLIIREYGVPAEVRNRMGIFGASGRSRPA
jgi:hypothetical protein